MSVANAVACQSLMPRIRTQPEQKKSANNCREQYIGTYELNKAYESK